MGDWGTTARQKHAAIRGEAISGIDPRNIHFITGRSKAEDVKATTS